jgi:acetyl esterase/lipase
MRLFPCLLAILSAFYPASMHAVTMVELLDTNGVAAPVVYGTNDPTIQVLVPFLPKDLKPGEKRPSLVLIHGGGWKGGDPSIFFPTAKYFAARGIPSFSIGYRLAKQETNAPGVPECLADCRAAMRYLRSHSTEYGIDPEKIAVLGDSAGGHLAACLGTIPDPQDSAGVSSFANLMIPCNPIVDMGPGEGNTNSWFRVIQKGAAMEKQPTPEAIVPTSEQIAVAKSLSPISFASSKSAPTLVMHGLDDTIVTPEQSRKFAEALKNAGVPVELVLIPGARHAFILPKYTASEQQVVDTMITIDRFLAKKGYVTGEPTLIVSRVPAWIPKPRSIPQSSPSPTTR